MPGVLRARALRVGAGRTPAGMPGPTGAKKSARTSTTGPPGKCWAAWRSVAAPAGLPSMAGRIKRRGWVEDVEGTHRARGLRPSGRRCTDQERPASCSDRLGNRKRSRCGARQPPNATRRLFWPSSARIGPAVAGAAHESLRVASWCVSGVSSRAAHGPDENVRRSSPGGRGKLDRYFGFPGQAC